MTFTQETATAGAAAAPKPVCFHCGLSVPKSYSETITILGEERAMCCPGCAAVAQAIVESGMEAFYEHRTANAPTGVALVPDFLEKARVYDNPAVQKSFVQALDENIKEAALILEGITCAACVWLNEKHLNSLDGVSQASVNYSTHRMSVKWDNAQIQLSEIMAAVAQLGYKATPFDVSRHRQGLEKERKQQLKRLGLAGVLGMQIMMLAAGLYLGDYFGMVDVYRSLLNGASLILALPIMFYSAIPFFKAAWRDLRIRQPGMDVPVSLGILGAFIASVWHTVTQQGPVYFDSIAMFVFFLLSARYFELSARRKAADSTERLMDLSPALATRVNPKDGAHQTIPVAELAVEDHVSVRPGEVIPADGVIINGLSSVDESLLTGESVPKRKVPAQRVVGGSLNVESPLLVEVEKVGADTVLSHMLRLIDRAQTEKPRLTQLADRIASYFVLVVLTVASLVALFWWQAGSTEWVAITISVLVVTCPCALSLATPTALTAAAGRLTGLGVLISRGHALETMAKVTDVVFDKTGTLTCGELSLGEVKLGHGCDRQIALNIAAALEQVSEHPIGKAICRAAETLHEVGQDVVNTPGKGMSGSVAGKVYHIGSAEFVQESLQSPVSMDEWQTTQGDRTAVFLADEHRLIAAFYLEDQVRPDAESLIRYLKSTGRRIHLYSGDNERAVKQLAAAIGIEQAEGELKPEGKLSNLQALQQQGAVVAMVGDGVNDGPVLAAAQVSIAMGSAAQVAMSNADVVLVSNQLSALCGAFQSASKTVRVIRQNISWAVGYNTLVLPAAAMGWVAPWMAAIGMSLSSLLVVANAMRLARQQALPIH
ncbi:MAG: heavy metal translocating P-type ATPase [Gammaproteobacteria bacterium]|nr:heavy metal translocating P-type ATPase [Gammaproteobacteria bacterium]